jgi:phosphotransferase system HPr-like phosphotransfer protein
VNYWSFYGRAAGAAPYVLAEGSDTNIELLYSAKGAAGHVFYSAGLSFTPQFKIAHTASAVNYLQATGGATGVGPRIDAAGTDTNIDLSLYSKGTGGVVTYGSGQATATITTTTLGGSVSTFDTGVSAGNGGSVVFGAASGVWRFAAIKSYATNGSSNSQGDLFFLTRRNATDATLTTAAHITAAGVISLGAASGSESLRVTPVASAVNYLNVQGSITANSVALLAQGSDTNIPLAYFSKGTGSHIFYSDSNKTQFVVTHTASAVNYLQVTGGATGIAPTISAQGSDANINITYATKGTFSHLFQTGGNYQFVVANTASAVNYMQVTGAATGGGVNFSAQGTDANIFITYDAKGAEAHSFRTNGGAQQQFRIAHTASAVNCLQVTGAATGSGVTLSAQGSDTNIDLALTPKGTGVLSFGTYTAGIVAQAGYISIKDSAGNVRRLLVG